MFFLWLQRILILGCASNLDAVSFYHNHAWLLGVYLWKDNRYTIGMTTTGPLVLWVDSLNILAPISDMDRTVSRMYSIIFIMAWTISSSYNIYRSWRIISFLTKKPISFLIFEALFQTCFKKNSKSLQGRVYFLIKPKA